MKLPLAFVACGMAFTCAANEQEIQRALIQRDQQAAEFAAGVRGGDRAALEGLHARQRSEISTPPVHLEPALTRQLESYQRQKMADERVLILPPPVVREIKPPEKPLPLPGGPHHGVDPIPAHGTPN